MYTKYEEMKAMQSILKNYISNQKTAYETALNELKDETKNMSSNINNYNDSIRTVNATTGVMSYYGEEYNKGVTALQELEKAIMCFEMGYTQDNIQTGLADQRMQEGKKLFFELRTKNDAYKSIMERIAFDLYRSRDRHVDDLDNIGLKTKLENLDKEFEEGRLSKEQLIYYTNMCTHLSQNKDFIDYINNSSTQSRGTR